MKVWLSTMGKWLVFARMLGPWLQPPIRVNTLSPTGLASPDPTIEFAVLPCVLCASEDRCRTPSWWGMSPGSSWHAPAILSCQPLPLSGCSVHHTTQQARGSSFSSTLHARTHRQRWSGGCVAQIRPECLHPPLGWSRTRVLFLHRRV